MVSAFEVGKEDFSEAENADEGLGGKLERDGDSTHRDRREAGGGRERPAYAMGLPRSVRYCAYDINARIVSLTNCYFQLEGIAGIAEHRDVLCDPPRESADLALLLKMYHCLERRRCGAGWQAVAEVHHLKDKRPRYVREDPEWHMLTSRN